MLIFADAVDMDIDVQTRTCAISFAFLFVSVGITLATGGLLQSIEDEFNLPDSSVSSLGISLYMGVKSLSRLFTHWLILKTGLRTVAFLGGILLCFGLLVSGR